MNIDDAIDDYNSRFGTDYGVCLFAGSDEVFIRLVKESLKVGKRISKRSMDKFFPPIQSGAVY